MVLNMDMVVMEIAIQICILILGLKEFTPRSGCMKSVLLAAPIIMWNAITWGP
jgi:hypothetical protein